MFGQFLLSASVFCLLAPQTLAIPDEAYGYIDVREGAHMFWWFYGATNSMQSRAELPIVLWLQGGPGAGGSGYGNFGKNQILSLSLFPP